MVTKSRTTESTKKSSLDANYDWKRLEAKVRRFVTPSLLEPELQKRLSGRRYGYVEGPPTLNNAPHIGHLRGRVMKDLWYRFNTLSGKNIVFRGGWDTQGLPVELQAEKELGLSGNKWQVLKEVGEEKLVEACKQLIRKYERSWLESDRLLGLLLDHSKSYKTYRDAYIEREWKFLETAWRRGLLGEGFKVVPYCPSCMTSLSHAEVASEYESLEDPSLFYKVKADDGSFLTVWTTMPFTVVTDELVGVNPVADYLYVKVGGETWVLGAERRDALEQELGVKFGEVVKQVKGAQLEGLRYEHPLVEMIPGLMRLKLEGSIHKVVAEEFVDTTTGTGLVHLAPANGEDDYSVALKRKLPVFSPLDDQVRFTAESGRFQGVFVRDADAVVSRLLKEKGSLIREGRITHDYPVCWRSGHRLVWVVRREYFYWIDKLRRDLTEAAEAVDYYFESPRNRFVEFLRDSPPWCITRERIWGAPLPIWVCSECKEKVPAFSRKRIVELAAELPDGRNFELHRPWIDRVVLRCPKCESKAYREQFVLDTWHNSGASPYAAFTDEEFTELVPVDFLTEGIDQTRGWAYTLLALSVLMKERPVAPYRSFLFQGHVLDDQGRKMSKSLGNTVQGLDALRSYSVDLLRFYLLWKSSPIDPLNLDMKEMTGRPYQVLNTLYHLHVYLVQNGILDGYNPARYTIEWARKAGLLTDVEEWLLQRVGEVEKEVKTAYKECRYNDACKSLEKIIIEVLSQNYVRMVRGDLWSDSPRDRTRRLAIYAALGYALSRIDKLTHPVSPFLTEYLYQEVFCGTKSWKTPLLAAGFEKTVTPTRSKRAKAAVDAALEVEEVANSARTRAKLKRRWPLSSMHVLAARGKAASNVKEGEELIAVLCNVKKVEVHDTYNGFPASIALVPNRSRVGAAFKEKTGEILNLLKPMQGEPAWRAHLSGRGISLQLESGVVEVPLSALDFQVNSTGDFEVAEKGGIMVAIQKKRDERLLAEGLSRDVARRLQSLRKTRGFTPTALLRKASVAGLEKEELELLIPLKKELAFLVRVRDVEFVKKADGRRWHKEELDGRPIYLDIA